MKREFVSIEKGESLLLGFPPFNVRYGSDIGKKLMILNVEIYGRYFRC